MNIFIDLFFYGLFVFIFIFILRKKLRENEKEFLDLLKENLHFQLENIRLKTVIEKLKEEKANEIDYYNFICKGLLEKELQKKSVYNVKVTLEVYKKLKHQLGLSHNCEIKKIYGIPLIIDSGKSFINKKYDHFVKI